MTKHARVDGTGLLLEWGLSDYGGQGLAVPDDFTYPVGTVRWNGSAWVAVPQPDARGFELALHDVFPGQAFLTFITAFPASWLFLQSIRDEAWAQALSLAQLALGTAAINQGQFDAMAAAAATYHIPWA